MRSKNEAGVLRRSLTLAFAAVFVLPGLFKCALAQSEVRPRKVGDTRISSASPIIRIALMTDVSAVTLTCQSGLSVGEPSSNRDAVAPLAHQIRVEVKQPKAAVGHSRVSYRILIASFDDRAQARRLTSELQRKYREPLVIDESGKNSGFGVVMGPFQSQEDAERLLGALRKGGYKSARLEQGRDAGAAQSTGYSESHRGSAKTIDRVKSEPTATGSTSREPQLVASYGGRTIASSADRLVIAVWEPAAEKFQETRRDVERPSKQTDHYDFGRAPRAEHPEPDEEAPSFQSYTDMQTPAAFIRVEGKPYRGEVQIVLNKRGRANVINAVALEDYLRSVVPMELSPLGFPQMEALKAQAVAARSYALFHRGEHDDEGYDLRDDARSQVYGGVNAEHELSDRAVQETSGIVAAAGTEDGRWVPIDAMYTANCGGHTENNEDVFGTKPRSYLRAVACEVDPFIATGRELVTNRQPIPIASPDGRPVARDAALLEVLGFLTTRQVTARYLGATVDDIELKAWSERAARICGLPAPLKQGPVTLARFAEVVAAAVYGEGRASVLVTPSDANYILDGLQIQEGAARSQNPISTQGRASVALLLKNGVLRLPAGTVAELNSPVSHALAIETLGRALVSRLRDSNLLNPITSQKREPLNVARSISGLKSETAAGIEGGKLVLGSHRSLDGNLIASTPQRGYITVETTAARVGRAGESASEAGSPTRVSGPAADASGRVEIPRALEANDNRAVGIEVASDARLFRELGGESYPVSRMTLIGGEQTVYHLNSSGQIDFLETSASDRSAATDRYSRVASWQQRIIADEITSRLSRGRANVGQPQSITPVAFSVSGRVTELEIVGSVGRCRLRGSQIRSVLGLRENLFVVDPETDSKGHVIAFVFTGRGWGHGVGMCQTGAYGLAREGYSYKQILQKYYTGIRVQKIY